MAEPKKMNGIQMWLESKKINKKLKELPEKLVKKGARKAVREGAKFIQQDAKSLAARDTGALERSIRVRARKRHQ